MIHLVIGTPMYGGMCTSEYTQSLLNLSESANNSEGVKLTTIFLGNESLIQRGRNTIAYHFMNLPDATHLLFIDVKHTTCPAYVIFTIDRCLANLIPVVTF